MTKMSIFTGTSPHHLTWISLKWASTATLFLTNKISYHLINFKISDKYPKDYQCVCDSKSVAATLQQFRKVTLIGSSAKEWVCLHLSGRWFLSSTQAQAFTYQWAEKHLPIIYIRYRSRPRPTVRWHWHLHLECISAFSALDTKITNIEASKSKYNSYQNYATHAELLAAVRVYFVGSDMDYSIFPYIRITTPKRVRKP